MNPDEKEFFLKHYHEHKAAVVKEYKQDFLSYFEMKLTKEGADLGNSSNSSMPMPSGGNSMKLPKR